MKQITIKKGIRNYSFTIRKHKYVLGENIYQKNMLLRCFSEFAANIGESEYAQSNLNTLHIYLDNKEVNRKTAQVILLDIHYSLYQDMKLQSKSLLLQALLSDLENGDYQDIFYTIDQLLISIADQFNKEHDIKIRPISFSASQYVKLVSPYLMFDDEVMNEYDLDIEQFLLTQIEIAKLAVSNNGKDTCIIINYPLISETLLKKIESIQNCYVLIICKKVSRINNLEDILICDNDWIDLGDNDCIYEKICCNTLSNSNLLEAKQYMKNELIQKQYTDNCSDIQS